MLLYRSAAACVKNLYTYTFTEDPVGRAPMQFRYVKDARDALGKDIQLYTRTKKSVLDPPEYCLYRIRHTLKKILQETRADTVRVFIGGSDNFRLKLDPEYKAGRPPKPEYFQLAKDYLMEFCDAEIVNGEEADDRLAQAQSINTVLCSMDKDLYQVPGAHYNWMTGEMKYITKEEGDEWFWIQMLVGDTVDNITGINGVGLIYATELVQMFDGNLKQVRGFVQGMYLQEFKSMKEFFLNVRLLYIKRDRGHINVARIMTEVV